MGNREQAFSARNTLESSSSCSQATLLYHEGLFAFYGGRIEHARGTLMRAMLAGADQLKVVNLLGKCCLKLRNFRDAIACFERANELSPRSMERMCDMAESHAELGHSAQAGECIQQGVTQDSGSEKLKSAASKVAIHGGDSKKAAALLAGTSSLTFLIADLNNSAVARIRMGETREGLNLYKKTIEALPVNEVELLARVRYNMALAYARDQDIEASLAILDEVRIDSRMPISEKFRNLRRKLEVARRTGRQLEFDDVDEGTIRKTASEPIDEELDDAEDARIREHIMKAQPCQRCLHLIFRAPKTARLVAKELLKNAPRFTLRSAISREEGFGVEKTCKS